MMEQRRPPTAKRDRSASSAIDRFLLDSRRRSCSFVNPSSEALTELSATARAKGLVLTACEEPNVGSVARLVRPQSLAVPADEAEVVCPRCVRRDGQDAPSLGGKPVHLALCASCLPPLIDLPRRTPPFSPPSVIDESSTSMIDSLFGAEPPPRTTSPQVLRVSTNDGEDPPSQKAVRIGIGLTYDVYDVSPKMGPRAGRAAPPSSPAEDAPPLPPLPPLSTAVLPPSLGAASQQPPSLAPYRRPPLSSRPSFATQTVVNAVVEAVAGSRETRPELTEDGTGGVYLIRSRRPSSDDEPKAEKEATAATTSQRSSPPAAPPVAIFKPSDEEAGSSNNPRGLHGEAHVMREGFRPGGGAAREVAAYKLDRGGFAGVPTTALDRLMLRTRTGTRLAEQTGSIQRFVPSEGDASDYRFDGSEFGLRASQRIMLLDLRLFNCDRHEGNVLVRPPPLSSCAEGRCFPEEEEEEEGGKDGEQPCGENPDGQRGGKGGKGGGKGGGEGGGSEGGGSGGLDVVPIDHAFVLPRFGYFREAELAWRYWLSAARPFSAEAVAYVAALNIDDDVAAARHAGIGGASCATLRACTMLLKAALLGGGGRKGEAGATAATAATRASDAAATDAHAAAAAANDAADADGGAGNGAAVTPRALAAMLMREPIDAPSPFEVMCGRALGVADAHEDGALIDHVAAAAGAAAAGGDRHRQRGPGDGCDGGEAADFVPPPQFFTRLAALLEERYGPPRAADA